MKRGIKSSAAAALATLALALVPASLQAAEITVPSGAILTIQQGVDAAAPGDTVIVLPGTYVNNAAVDYSTPAVNIGLEKPGLKLKAVGPPGSVKLVGPGSGQPHTEGIWIDADNVRVEGFDISGFGRGIEAAGQTQGRPTRITGNTIHDCSSYGIQLDPAVSSNYEVDHNTLDGCLGGILLNGSAAAGPNWQAYLHHNRVTATQQTGIMLWQSPGCELDNNECDNNDWFGIYLASSPNCTADHNEADNNANVGILVGNSPNCAVAQNEANNNRFTGIGVWASCGSTFEHNVAEGNGQYDLSDGDSDRACNTYLKNRAGTAYPSLALWDVKPSK